MLKILILLGSKTDEPVMQETVKYLEWFGISSKMVVASAHRDPQKVIELSSNAQKDGFGCIIAAAGMSAALPGVVAAHTSLPVIGVPLEGGLPGGVDALYSIVQMPAGIPVACMAVGKSGAKNAAVLVARILALSHSEIANKIEEFKKVGYKI